MSVQRITHEVRLQNWSRIVKECRGSGKSIKTWCAEQNINLKTYYHWQKLVCQETCRELTMTRKQPPETVVRNDVQIHIYCGADAATVEAALSRLC